MNTPTLRERIDERSFKYAGDHVDANKLGAPGLVQVGFKDGATFGASLTMEWVLEKLKNVSVADACENPEAFEFAVNWLENEWKKEWLK